MHTWLGWQETEPSVRLGWPRQFPRPHHTCVQVTDGASQEHVLQSCCQDALFEKYCPFHKHTPLRNAISSTEITKIKFYMTKWFKSYLNSDCYEFDQKYYVEKIQLLP